MIDRPEDERPDRELVDILFHRGRTTYLLGSLLLVTILYPYWEDWRFGEILGGILIVGVLVAGVHAISGSRTAVGLALVVALPALFAEGYRILYPEQAGWALIVSPLLATMFFAVVFIPVFGHVLRRGPVTAGKLHGAVCGYILIGYAWASLYLLVERLSPGSFTVSETLDPGGVPDANDLLYKSFTTLTTTGFGDITAITSAAQSLAMLEQILGIFFVAIVIARLAGVYPPEPLPRD